ncbi:hypothetical protein HAX54_042055, partial [Datura stramonium]|nr:hypothetical protein [Datura stramonium]
MFITFIYNVEYRRRPTFITFIYNVEYRRRPTFITFIHNIEHRRRTMFIIFIYNVDYRRRPTFIIFIYNVDTGEGRCSSLFIPNIQSRMTSTAEKDINDHSEHNISKENLRRIIEDYLTRGSRCMRSNVDPCLSSELGHSPEE